MTTVAEATKETRRSPSPRRLNPSNRKCHELEMPVTPFLSSNFAFLIATALGHQAHFVRFFQLPAPSLQLLESNRARKELEFAVSPAESLTSNFLIAVAKEGKAPDRDKQTAPQERMDVFSGVSMPMLSRPLTSDPSPLTSAFLIDTNAIRNAPNSFVLTKNQFSNRHKSAIFKAVVMRLPPPTEFLIDSAPIRIAPKPRVTITNPICNRRKTSIFQRLSALAPPPTRLHRERNENARPTGRR